MAAGSARAESPGCRPEAGGASIVRGAVDGRTIVLTDGREVRLAGIELVQQAREAARSALQQLAGKEVALRTSAPGTDRYGRLAAFAFVAGQDQSVQEKLVSDGHALGAPGARLPECAAALLQAEARARTAGLGIWASPARHRADRPAEIGTERGRFALVEGRVISVREFGATIYVNFGRRWSEDFTVTVPKRSERAFTTAGLDLKKLGGRHVRVRGYVEERGGPWIEATRPEQIEIVGRR
jgi:endonuclease YncB( thermonuclease family)